MKEKQRTAILERARAVCATRGVRLTPLREEVLKLVWDAGKPTTAYEILERMRSGSSSPPTVYRALDFLVDNGLIHKLESLHAFVGCAHPEHPHSSQFLICDDCGEVSEVESEAVIDSLRSAGDARGFTTKRPVVELRGTCAECAKPHA